MDVGAMPKPQLLGIGAARLDRHDRTPRGARRPAVSTRAPLYRKWTCPKFGFIEGRGITGAEGRIPSRFSSTQCARRLTLIKNRLRISLNPRLIGLLEGPRRISTRPSIRAMSKES